MLQNLLSKYLILKCSSILAALLLSLFSRLAKLQTKGPASSSASGEPIKSQPPWLGLGKWLQCLNGPDISRCTA